MTYADGIKIILKVLSKNYGNMPVSVKDMDCGELKLFIQHIAPMYGDRMFLKDFIAEHFPELMEG